MSHPFEGSTAESLPVLPAVQCPICRREVPGAQFLSAYGLDAEVVALVAINTPGWNGEQGLCRDCITHFSKALAYLRSHDPGLDLQKILPTGVRLGAPRRYRGRGVTIAFLDSGFYAHPDLVGPTDRIVRYVDITN